MTLTTHAGSMHHDSSSAALAVAQYETENRLRHEQKNARQGHYYAAGRILLSTVFIAGAVAKMLHYGTAVAAVGDTLTDASILLPFGIAIELVGGLMLAIGLKVRVVSIGLIGYLGAVTLLLHNDLRNPLDLAIALANLAFAGALLMVIGHGAGTLSVDRVVEHKAMS